MVPYGHAKVLFILFVFFVVNAVSLKRDLFDLKKRLCKARDQNDSIGVRL